MQPTLPCWEAPEGLVSILTGPEGPMQRRRHGERARDARPVSILTGPEGPMQLAVDLAERKFLVVSILTGPEGPMQLRARGQVGQVPDVSILTGPEGPMQHLRGLTLASRSCRFQSSPAPKGRCNERHDECRPTVITFQSSPAPKGRCNSPRPQRQLRACCFNPHRPRRADATVAADAEAGEVDVSILTGPEGPMQPRASADASPAPAFQSSPAPKGRCNCARPRVLAVCRVSILTGPEGPMQPASASPGRRR